MKINKDGFFQPTIDSDRCTNCGICIINCSFNSKTVSRPKDLVEPSYFAAWSINSTIRKNSASGGLCYELESSFLEKGYKAILVRYNKESEMAEHYLATTNDEIADSVGSKYLQSYTVEALKKINKGEKYLVVGTPCMIDSVRKYIQSNKMDSDFLLVDFFCHGVPSYNLFFKYLDSIKNRIGQIKSVKWRDKQSGWHDSWVMCLDGSKGDVHSFYSKGDVFYKFYLKNRCLGKACYKDCKYKNLSSAADLRIGDLWGEKYKSDEAGVNGVVVFTQKGGVSVETISSSVHFVKESKEIVTRSQMKKNPRVPHSFQLVSHLLKTDMSLSVIDKLSFIYELPNNIFFFGRYLFSKFFM